MDDGVVVAIAAQTGNLAKLVQLLQGSNAAVVNFADRNSNCMTPLLYASRLGHTAIVKVLLENGADLNARETEANCNALLLASSEGHYDVVELLIANEANVDAADKDGFTALHMTCLKGYSAICKLLLQSGAIVDALTNSGWSPLLLAATHGHVNNVQLLIDMGADTNLRNQEGRTAIHQASLKSHRSIVQILASNGGDVNARDKDQRTPLFLAYQSSSTETTKVLLEFGANLAARDEDSWTVLHHAACRNLPDIIEQLALHSADISIINKDQHTPICLAVLHESPEAAAVLIKYGADVHSKYLINGNETSLLRLAVSKNHVDLSRLLLESAADVNAKESPSLLSVAIKNANIPLIRLLLHHGAEITVDGTDLVETAPPNIQKIITEACRFSNKGFTFIPPAALNQAASTTFALRLTNNRLRAENFMNDIVASSSCVQWMSCLYLSGNSTLGCIPSSIGDLKSLKTLSLANCGLSLNDVRNVSFCLFLASLDLSDNPLGDLPVELAQLNELRRLTAARCELQIVPVIVTSLTSLSVLDLSGNAIDELPKALATLRLLTCLILTDCPLKMVPAALREASSTRKLLPFLLDIDVKQEAVYRSRIFLVGFSGVGKTSLVHSLFPPNSVLQKRSPHILNKLLDVWQERMCTLQGTRFVYKRPSQAKGEAWEEADSIELEGAIITSWTDGDDYGFDIQAKDQPRKYQFKCSSALEREDWIKACKFCAKKSATEGITITQRQIDGETLSKAAERNWSIEALSFLDALADDGGSKPALQQRQKQPVSKVPLDTSLQLVICDFAGHSEYFEIEQSFICDNAVYVVLWDTNPARRDAAVVELTLWLTQLQLTFGPNKKDEDHPASNSIVYIVGTYVPPLIADAHNCSEAVSKVIDQVGLTLQYFLMDPIDINDDVAVLELRQELARGLATQSHLGQQVPTSYLKMERHLQQHQERYRIRTELPLAPNAKLKRRSRSSVSLTDLSFSSVASVASFVDDSQPLLKSSDVTEQLGLTLNDTAQGLKMLHQWGLIVYSQWFSSWFFSVAPWSLVPGLSSSNSSFSSPSTYTSSSSSSSSIIASSSTSSPPVPLLVGAARSISRSSSSNSISSSTAAAPEEPNVNASGVLAESIITYPQWLTTSVLTSFLTVIRLQSFKRAQLDEENDLSGLKTLSFLIAHSDLNQLSPLWASVPVRLQPRLMQIMYSLNIAVPEAGKDPRSFADSASYIPQLMPVKPPHHLNWERKPSVTRVIKLNGIPTNFYSLLFARLRAQYNVVDLDCWQRGFLLLFTDGSERSKVLITIHDDTRCVRFCTHHAPKAANIFADLNKLLLALLRKRYQGVRVINEYVGCPCEGCQQQQWYWNTELAQLVSKDTQIKAYSRDITAKRQLAVALSSYIHPNGKPHEFAIKDMFTTKLDQLLCPVHNTNVPRKDMLATIA